MVAPRTTATKASGIASQVASRQLEPFATVLQRKYLQFLQNCFYFRYLLSQTKSFDDGSRHGQKRRASPTTKSKIAAVKLIKIFFLINKTLTCQ